ncbi:PTS glucose transporter subunit IIBC [Candidatus Purcelliella pentastirinorum]|uniref:PTS system glucose-specific EIICB component n=1 Tax=Candidatus Purcelliella pentastirinorum TaxID=472834 RepID=A0AAX3NAX2_9ENTR|nr:PTS glucose transporter subunit IIBC [Candidatus Purcelliella pentastirinorum]WDI78620.1 PTS glucose transporter subunit IIBC [Candidatus Purcelliella pentastirinorum]WDR80352.1 PTS glucose transporter subunit IIBC [Candidatus Purcelliella pentastirinorum]
MNKNIFINLQKIGKSLMLPVSVLPLAGILLGIGSSNLNFLPYIISKTMAETGGSIFINMPLIFSIGVALGFTKNNGVSALAAVISYIIINKTLLIISNNLHITKQTYDTGVIGGIIAGSLSAIIFNRFHMIKLPEYIGFFSGNRFVPIMSGILSILIGIILSFIWPPVGKIIENFSHWAAYQNPIIAFSIYGIVERALIPFGLHHIWNVPFQMQVGDFINHLGQTFHGDIPRYMAGDITAGKLSGGYLFKMYGLPAAAIAIWKSAKKENQKKIAGIMLSGALTAFLTGITEPIEFTFLFVAPILYIIHSILSGLAFAICIILNMRNGISFSHGLIDFILLSNNGNKLWLFPIIGGFYSILYYSIFKIIITKFDLKTPGREISNIKIKKNTYKNINFIIKLINSLGGKKNIINIDACITRLRIDVKKISKINENKLRELGVAGIVKIGNGLQLIFGTQSDNIKTAIEKYIKKN